MIKRRELLQTGSLVLLLGRAQIARGASIVAVRVWPAEDYSRVTLESDTALKAKQSFISQPPRLAVDIEGIELNPALRELVASLAGRAEQLVAEARRLAPRPARSRLAPLLLATIAERHVRAIRRAGFDPRRIAERPDPPGLPARLLVAWLARRP